MLYNIEYFGFVYKWCNVRNNKYYIGSHHGSIDDGYTGSGVWFRRAYDIEPENFVREILEYITINDPAVTISAEQRYLTEVCEVGNKSKCYNISRTAGGGYQLTGKTPEEIAQIYKAISGCLKNKTDDEKAEAIAKMKATLAANPERYAAAIEKSKETKRKWSPEKKAQRKERQAATLAANPEIQRLAAIKRKATIESRTDEERAAVKLNQSNKWSDERKQIFRENIKKAKEAKSAEQLAIEKERRSNAQTSRDAASIADAHSRAAEKFKNRSTQEKAESELKRKASVGPKWAGIVDKIKDTKRKGKSK